MANIRKISELFPDIISDQTLWSDFFDAVDEVIDEQFESPLQELVNIRNVSRLSDEEIILLTVRMLGFNINKTNLTPVKDNLAGGTPMLGLFHEIDGLDTFYKFIEFVTGRAVDIEYLYTNNYADFYPEPYGPLLIDGGDWYKSTHINLWIGELASDRKKQLQDYAAYIRSLLGTFYEYAPANLVVHTMGTLLLTQMNLCIAMGVIVARRDYHYLPGFGTLLDISVDGPGVVDEGSTHEYKVRLHWEDGTSSTDLAYDWHSDRLSIAIVSRTGKAGFGLTASDTTVTLTVNHLGHTALKTISVLAKNLSRELESITVLGQTSLDGGESTSYTAIGKYSNGEEDQVFPKWRVQSPFAMLDQEGLMVTSKVSRDLGIYVQATIESREGVVINGVLPVTLRSLEAGVYLTSLVISGPAVVYERTTSLYIAKAVFSDGTEQSVIPKWDVSVKGDYISMMPNGNLAIGIIDSMFSMVVKATYTHRGKTVVATMPVQVRQSLRSVVQIFINGPDYVVEGEQVTFRVNALWSDGSVSMISPSWLASKYNISQKGVFVAYGVRITESIVLSARYTDPAGNLLIISRTLVVSKYELASDFISIKGPHAVSEGNVAIFEPLISWNDGSVTVTSDVDWSIVEGYTFATISSDGHLSFSNPTVTTLTLRVTKNVDGKQLVAEKPVILIPATVITTSLIIGGPEIVTADSQSQYAAAVTLDNGDIVTVQPVWSTEILYPNINSEAFNLESGPVAYISTYGLLHARHVDEPTQFLLTARYFKEVASMVVTVINTPENNPNTIEGHRIDGPTAFRTDTVASYAQMILFNGRSRELAVSSTWSINVPSEVAEITEDGYLTAKSNVDATITVTALYECSTFSITDTMVVQMISTDTISASLRIDGPSSVAPDSITKYEAMLVYDDESAGESNVTGSVMWSVTSPYGIGVDEGFIYVPNLNDVVTFTITIELQEGFNVLRATKIVTVSQVLPIYGAGPIGIIDEAGINQYLTNQMSGRQSALTFTATANVGEYIYFAHPAELGVAQFIDTSNGFEGAMDGASWPLDGGIGTTSGPILVTMDDGNGGTQDWYLHRSDFGGIGEMTFQVNYV